MKKIAIALLLVICMIVNTGLAYAGEVPDENREKAEQIAAEPEVESETPEVEPESEAAVEPESEEAIAKSVVTAGVADRVPRAELLSTWMPDENLQQAVATALGIGIDQITQENMELLINLPASNINIRSIKGLEWAENLESVDLSYNLLTEVELSGLSKLEHISLARNQLTAVQLSDLPKLQKLELNDNYLTALQLTGFPELLEVNANDNQISEVQLKDLPLFEELKIDQNRVTDLQKVERDNVNSVAIISIMNQEMDTIRTSVGEEFELPQCVDESGTVIPWVLPGTDGIDYTLTGNTIKWNTPGTKVIQANHANSPFTYSVKWHSIVLGTPDADGWINAGVTESVDGLISNTFSRNGMDYRVDSGYTDHLGIIAFNERNTVTNLTTGDVYTYTYSMGSGEYSNLYYQLGGSGSYAIMFGNLVGVYVKLDGGREMIKKVYTNLSPGVRVELVTYVTDTGEIKHDVSIENTSGSTISDFMCLARIDTQLNGNDNVNLYANGAGGFYITEGSFRLYCEGVEGVSHVYGGFFNNLSQANFDNESGDVYSAYGKTSDQLLTDGSTDSGVYYGPETTELVAGGKIQFTFQERIYGKDEPEPMPVNAAVFSFLNENGDPIADDLVLSGDPGDNEAVSFDRILTLTDGSTYEFVNADGVFLTLGGDLYSGTITFTNTLQNITLNYKRVYLAGVITAVYQDEAGKRLGDDVVLTGDKGKAYRVEAKKFAGYKLIKTEGAASGLFGDDDIRVTYTYQKTGGQGTRGSKGTGVKTGDNANVLLYGILLAVSGMGLVYRKRWKMSK